jgi:hypothetical protein
MLCLLKNKKKMKKFLSILLITFILPSFANAENSNCGELDDSKYIQSGELCKEDRVNDIINTLYPQIAQLDLTKSLHFSNEEFSEERYKSLETGMFSKVINLAIYTVNNGFYVFVIGGIFILMLAAFTKSVWAGSIAETFTASKKGIIVGILFVAPVSMATLSYYPTTFNLHNSIIVALMKNSLSSATSLFRSNIQARNQITSGEAKTNSIIISNSTKEKGQQLTKMALCGVRTERAKQQNYFTLLDDKPLSTGSSILNEGMSWIGGVSGVGDIDDAITSYDFTNVQKQLSGCYGNKYNATKKGIELTFLGYGGIDSCHLDNKSTVDPASGEEKTNYGWNESKFGYDYECGAIYYADTSIDDNTDIAKAGVDDSIFNSVVDQLEEDELAITTTFNTLGFTTSLVSKLEKIVEKASKEGLNENDTLKEINTVVVDPLANDINGKVKQLSKKYESKLKGKTGSERSIVLNTYNTVSHKRALKSMLGGYTPGDFYEGEKSNNNNIKYLLNNYALKTAEYLNAANCYKNVDDYRTISSFHNSSLSDDEESIKKVQEGFGTNTFECLNTEMIYGGEIKIDLVGTGLDMPAELASITTYFDEETRLRAGYQVAQEKAVQYLNEKAKKYQAVLNAYIYAVEKATAQSLAKSLKNVIDEKGLTDISKFGVMKLPVLQFEYSAYTSNAAAQVNSLYEVFSVDSGDNALSTNYLNGQKDNYIAFQGFADSDVPYQNLESKIADKSFNFSFIDTASFYNQKNDYALDSDSNAFNKTKLQNDDIASSDFQRYFLEIINRPLDPFRRLYQAKEGQSLSARMNECSDLSITQCADSKNHIFNAVSEFGDEQTGFYITAITAQKGSEGLSGILKGVGDDNSKKKKSKAKAILAKAGILISLITGAAKILIDIAAQVAPIMLLLGIFLGKVVPAIALIRFIVELFRYFISTIYYHITGPFVALSMFFGEEKKLNPIYSMYTYIYLHPIIVVGWYLIALELINLFAYASFSLTTPILDVAGGLIDSLFAQGMYYFINGVLLLFIVKVVTDFSIPSNYIYGVMNVNAPTNSDNSMGTERMITTGALYSVTQTVTGVGANAAYQAGSTSRDALRRIQRRKQANDEKRDNVLGKVAESVQDKKEEEKKED